MRVTGRGVLTPSLHRVLADWPVDVAALADHLGHDRFAVMGLSSGGPYVIATVETGYQGMASAKAFHAPRPAFVRRSHRRIASSISIIRTNRRSFRSSVSRLVASESRFERWRGPDGTERSSTLRHSGDTPTVLGPRCGEAVERRLAAA